MVLASNLGASFMYNKNTSNSKTFVSSSTQSKMSRDNLVSSAKFSDSALCNAVDVVQSLISLLICREIGGCLWEKQKQKLTGTPPC